MPKKCEVNPKTQQRRKGPTPLQLPTTCLVEEQECTLMPLLIRQVSDRLFIAGYPSATKRTLLNSCGITHILNLAGNTKCPNLYPEEFTYCTLSIADSACSDLTAALPMALSFIHNALQNSGTVLVHCAMGRSRAPTIASAYLMWSAGLTFDEALAEVQAVQPAADPNLGFCVQLQQLHSISVYL